MKVFVRAVMKKITLTFRDFSAMPMFQGRHSINLDILYDWMW